MCPPTPLGRAARTTIVHTITLNSKLQRIAWPQLAKGSPASGSQSPVSRPVHHRHRHALLPTSCLLSHRMPAPTCSVPPLARRSPLACRRLSTNLSITRHLSAHPRPPSRPHTLDAEHPRLPTARRLPRRLRARDACRQNPANSAALNLASALIFAIALALSCAESAGAAPSAS